MTLYAADGTELTEATLTGSHLTSIDAPPAQFTVDEAVYEDFDPVGVSMAGAVRPARYPSTRLRWAPGQVISQDDIDAAYPTAALTTVAPGTGPAAGGTAVVLTGSGFAGASGVKFGTVAATGVNVINDTTIHCTAPAQAAATVGVTVTTEAGNVTKANAYIYT